LEAERSKKVHINKPFTVVPCLLYKLYSTQNSLCFVVNLKRWSKLHNYNCNFSTTVTTLAMQPSFQSGPETL